MMLIVAAASVSSTLLTHLANPAARALVLAGVTALGMLAFRVKATSLRLFLWRGVLYAAIAMPLLTLLLPPLSIPAPAFLPYTATHSAEIGPIPGDARASQSPANPDPSSTEVTRPISSLSKVDQQLRRETQPVASATTTRISCFPPLLSPWISWISTGWSMVVTGIYLAVASLLLLRFFVGLAMGRRLIQTSPRIDEAQVQRRLVSYASRLTFIPRAAESEIISVPVTMGALRSTILLPAGWREWDETKLDAVLAHEMSHVARRDGLTQRLSLLHRAIFWFSPLAWWLNRHLVELAEEASDEAVLARGADSKDYARILLGFFETLQSAPGRVWWQGVSMAKAGQAERQAEQRVEKILSWKGSINMNLKKSIALVGRHAGDSHGLSCCLRSSRECSGGIAPSAPCTRQNSSACGSFRGDAKS